MHGNAAINGLMIFFSVTTLVVILYPIIKLTPSWLERSVYRRIAFHRSAVEALGLAMARDQNDPAHLARLAAAHSWHGAALSTLAPGTERPDPVGVDIAA